MTSSETRKRTAEEWVKKSFLIPGRTQNTALTYNFQALGLLDCELTEDWETIMRDPLIREGPTQNFSRHAFLCSLWVLGGYELLRCMKEKEGDNPKLRSVYEMFKRVRIPIAKFEAPTMRDKTPIYPDDYGKAFSGINQGDYGWGVGPDVFITRNELAQVLYDLC